MVHNMFNLINYLQFKHKVTKDLKHNQRKGDALVSYLSLYTGDNKPLTLYNKVVANHLNKPYQYSAIGDLTTGEVLIFFSPAKQARNISRH